MGTMWVDGHDSDTVVSGTGNQHSYCSNGYPKAAAAGHLDDVIAITVEPGTCADAGAQSNHQLPAGTYEVRYNNRASYFGFDGTSGIDGRWADHESAKCLYFPNASTESLLGTFNVDSRGSGSWTGKLVLAGPPHYATPDTASKICVVSRSYDGFPGMEAPYRLLPPPDPEECPGPTVVYGPMGPDLAPDECADSAGFADAIGGPQSILQSPTSPSSVQDLWGTSTDTMSTTVLDQGFKGGGCTDNGTCDRLKLHWSRNTGFQRKTVKGLRLYHGHQINSWLVPSEEPSNEWDYDFLIQATDVNNDFGRVCIVKNAVKNPQGEATANVISRWPSSVHQKVTNGETKTLTLGASIPVGSGSADATYSHGFPVATGEIWGDYDFTKRSFFGTWVWPITESWFFGLLRRTSSKCDNSGGQNISSGIAYAYQQPVDAHYTFGGFVASQAIKGDPAMRSQSIPVVEGDG